MRNKTRAKSYTQAKTYITLWVIALIVIHFPMQYLFDTGNILGLETFHEVLDLDGERAFPAWTSQALFLLSGASILMYTKLPVLFRLLTGGLLVLFSIDESIQIHERFLDYFSDKGVSSSGFFAFSWLYVGLPVALIIVISLYRLYKTNKGLLPNGYYIGILIFLVGAVGMEGVGGLLEAPAIWYSVVVVGIEETIEFTGILILFRSVWGIDQLGVETAVADS